MNRDCQLTTREGHSRKLFVQCFVFVLPDFYCLNNSSSLNSLAAVEVNCTSQSPSHPTNSAEEEYLQRGRRTDIGVVKAKFRRYVRCHVSHYNVPRTTTTARLAALPPRLTEDIRYSLLRADLSNLTSSFPSTD